MLVKLSQHPCMTLVNMYADVFTKPGKPIAQDIKHKIELLDPAKPIPHHILQKITEKKFQEVQKYHQEYLEKGWIQPLYIPVYLSIITPSCYLQEN